MLSLGTLRSTVAFVKALAGEGYSDCWEKRFLTRLDCTAFLAELEDLLQLLTVKV